MSKPGSRGFGRTATLSLALGLLAGCGAARPKGIPAEIARPAKSTPSKTANLTALPVVLGKVETQQTALLQKSVARILGFVDIGGRVVKVYRDAYSSLYLGIAKKNGLPPESQPPTLIYFEPTFAADKPEATLTENGMYRITILNKYRAEAVRGRVLDKLKATLEPMGVTKERISVLPFHQVSASVRIYNKEYKLEVAPDFSRVVIEIPKDAVPKPMREADGSLKADSAGGLVFVNSMTSINFSYSYYVQKVNENACRFTFDAEYFNDMYIDSSCPNKISAPTDAALAALELANPTWKGMKEIIARASVPITSCLAGKEQERLSQRASISCTTSLQSSDGSRKEVSDALLKFAMQTHQQVLGEGGVKIGERPEWAKEAAAAAVLLFGDPSKYAQSIEKFTTDLINKTNTTVDEAKLEQSRAFIETIDEFSSRNQVTESNKKSGGGGFLFLLSFGKKSSGSSNKMSLEEIIKMAASTELTERASSLTKLLQENGYQHEVSEFQGKIRFYPKVNFSVKAKVDDIAKAAQDLATAELGDIVTENDSFVGEFSTEQPAYLRGTLVCGGTPLAFSKELDQISWWRSTAFRDAIAAEITSKITGKSCVNVSIDLWFETPPRSQFLPNTTETWNVDLLFPPATAGGLPTRSQGNSGQIGIDPKATKDAPSRVGPLGVTGKAAIGVVLY